MRVVIAPDKFKGRLTAMQAAQALHRGMRAVWPHAEFALVPMADGGEGTVEAFLHAGAQRRSARVTGPLGDPVDAPFAMQGLTAILEMACASGLSLVERDRLDPLHADTYGTGELLRAALDAGAKAIVIGIGGSATTDAGSGMMRALGVRFIAAPGEELGRDIEAYARLETIDVGALDARITSVPVVIAVDVDNPLCGPAGAARVFAPQKGANQAQIAALDRSLARIADVAARTLGRDESATPGAGAGGGVGYALMEFLNARMERGWQVIAKECGLEQALRGAQLCATGEGKIDSQTPRGKTVAGVAQLARRAGVAVVAFGGMVEDDGRRALEERGVTVRTADSSEWNRRRVPLPQLTPESWNARRGERDACTRRVARWIGR